MASLLNVCRFTAGNTGTGSFQDGTAQQGFLNLANAGAVDGVTYPYRAENATRTEWEIGYGVYNSGTGVLSRTPLKSSNSDLTVSFTTAPVVMVTPLAAEFIKREVLTANRTYYVRADGSDSNTGLSNTSGGAFLTLQKAANVVSDTLDLAGYVVTVQVGAGTYTSGVRVSRKIIGGTLVFSGDTTTPSNVVVSTTSADCFAATGTGVAFQVKGFKCVTTTAGSCINAAIGGQITVVGAMEYGACAAGHLHASYGGQIFTTSVSYTITGGAVHHFWSETFGSAINAIGATITLTGTPNFSGQFSTVQYGAGLVTVTGSTSFSGSATGKRYLATDNGVILTFAGGANFFPGNVAGTVSTGGLYS